MKKNSYLLVLAIISLIVVSCSGISKEDLVQNIKEQEALISDVNLANDNQDILQKLTDNYKLFGDKYPQDSITPYYLFRAADISLSTGSANEAMTMLNNIMRDYPSFEKIPHCVFLKGYIEENFLGNLGKAKSYYEEFLTKYPDHAFANDVRMTLKYLGKSPEEVIREFEQKNKEK